MTAKRSIGTRMLDGIERAGNALPDPVTLFVLAIVLLLVLSATLAGAGVSAINPATQAEVVAISLIEPAQLQRLFVEMPQVFAAFPPLALVLMMMLGVGVAEKTGLIAVTLGALVRAVPASLLTATVVFAGVMSSLAADAGYVVLVPLAAALFASVGRHPLAGLAAALAGVAGGFSSNLLITGLDPLLAGITTAAAQILDPDYVVEVTANYFLMIALVPVFVIVGAFITERMVEPRLGRWTGSAEAMDESPEAATRQRRGLVLAGLMALLLIVAAAFLVVPEGAVLRGEDGSLTPFLRGLVTLLFLFFLLCGLAYGIGAGSIRSDRDVVKMMGQAMADMGGYIVLAFFAAIFIALFSWSNLGVILAINGAEGLQNAGLTGAPLLFAVVVVSASLNILVGSASAKWAILAPVLVPMLMLLGISPEAAQAAYRIGDSITNPITPLLPYFALILIVAQRYEKNFGIGSLIALMLPYSIGFGIASTAVFMAWFVFDIPYWPGIGSTYTPG